jgi:predicted RNase H-like nuclease (RuvC/YqgF family)
MPPVITVNQETALPQAEVSAEASGQPVADQLDQSTESTQEAQEAKEQPEKKEKTPEEREIARLRRRVDSLTRQRYERDAQLQQLQSQQPSRNNGDQHESQDDEPVQLSKRELQDLIDRRAKELAPTIKQQDAEIEHRKAVVQNLSKAWGQEKFDSLASDLDAAFEGLADRSGKPKPATDAIFESEDPASLIEYLADPEHAEEAEAIARMDHLKAGRAIAKLELKLAAKKDEAKPQPSRAQPPIEPARGRGTVNTAPDPRDTKAWMKWANEQERNSR